MISNDSIYDFYHLMKQIIISVSHTTDDLVFEWFPVEDQPLVVEPLQLPQVIMMLMLMMMLMMLMKVVIMKSVQLELIKNTTEDCTASYSTGNFTCLMVVFKFRQ